MGIETKYEYIYYTVTNINTWSPRLREEWFIDGFNWDEACLFVEHKFKTSKDESVNKYRVEYAHWEDDIKYWRHKQIQHKMLPIFVQFHDDQPIKTEGEGDLFIIYEDEGVHYSSASDDDGNGWEDGPDYDGSVDGLAGAGGRL